MYITLPPCHEIQIHWNELQFVAFIDSAPTFSAPSFLSLTAQSFDTRTFYTDMNLGCGVGRRCPIPTGKGSGEWAMSLPRKKMHFCIKITRLWYTLTPFWSYFILFMVANEQQWTKWFTLQCYIQPNIAHVSRPRRIQIITYGSTLTS